MVASLVKSALHLLLLAGIVYVLTFFTTMPDFDLWARLAVGSLFFQTGHVLRHDIFSYLPTKELWIDHEWGTGVLLYSFAKLGGDAGIFLLKGLLIAAVFVMVGKTIKLRGRQQRPSPLFYGVLAYALFPGVASLLRSQMFTYLFFIAWLYGLERIRQGDRRMFWLFPCTMLPWVNLHGGFVAGLGLVVLYTIGEGLNRKSLLPYLAILLASVAVTLLNPYGFALWRYIVEASLMPRPFITEWQPISLRGPMEVIGGVHVHYLTGFFAVAALTFAAAFRAFVRSEKLDWTRLVVAVGLFLLAVRHQRHAVFFVLAAGTLFYQPMVELLDLPRRWLRKLLPQKSAPIATAARWGFGFLLPALVLTAIIPRLSHRMLVDYRRFPVGSIEFVKQNGLTGNLATAFDWGSYASWKLHPQCKVMLDGRYEEVFADDVSELAMQFAVRQGHWREPLERFPTDIVVLPKAFYSQTDLAQMAGWRPVYQDHVSVVLLPRALPPRPYQRPDFRDRAYGREDLAKTIVAVGRP
jgi:hypothetical protein